MNVIALFYPIICYGIYYFSLTNFPILDLLIGISLGMYVVVMKKASYRRMIALVHSLTIGLFLLLKVDTIFLWIYQLGGLSIALTRHDHIQPLCPMPKTRMIIMSCMPLFWIILLYLSDFISFSGICLAYMINGILMGFYIWMKERLDDKNRQLVTTLTTCLMLVLSLFLLKDYRYMWIIWAFFSQIIQIFRVKFI